MSCDCCLCCQEKVSATGRSLVQRSRTDCGVSNCVRYRNLKSEVVLARAALLRQRKCEDNKLVLLVTQILKLTQKFGTPLFCRQVAVRAEITDGQCEGGGDSLLL
jgi:hypothetical protein